MKAIATLLAAAALVVAPMAAHNAQAQVQVTLGAGLNTPLGEYADQSNAGYAIITGIGYRVMPMLVLGGEFSFYGNNASDQALEGYGDGWEMKSSLQQYAGLVKLLLPVRSHNVYAKGLVGSYHGTAKIISPDDEAKLSMSELGYGIGGGLQINGDRSSSLFLDVTYHTVSFDESETNTNFITYSAGAVISFDLFQ
jgi:hypothetical protein